MLFFLGLDDKIKELLYEKVNLSYSEFLQLSHLVVTLLPDVPRKIKITDPTWRREISH
ncbi:hypothetical protein CWATWH8502_1243 [Crocosphaera watsonii WH 8502]|uniref:Uncharacterized protein n=4 Tax=Crocosphaera watsonii TaxID=263511 RepID=T2JHU6_CROWT|nr:hypothetical protein [Crocosphaera watsonii]CCQ51439.1 hypothetical protein CWATWH8502_1243 [Crocosphaera watsonii WH 8502]CCQ57950.1 hypothetical protein CWATWH0005_3833 [Crocosphaera watsonii WH 0005]CCQ61527.1 hypothetical protein CWATWH0401_3475 [Crocosphaera watsonii WH 0401]CCQ64701.1 hypothetical protein CWATWH0402_5268 [Crocosphaera watsonii WH 0402]